MGTYFSGHPFPCPLFSLAATASWSLDSDRSRWVVVPCVAGGPCFSEQLNIRYFSEHLSLMKFQNRFEGWPTKVRLVKAMVFPVVVYRCESWTIKKAEHQRIDAFELWCWRKLLSVPWTARRSNQSILKEISPGCSLEGLMLKLKLQILWPPDAKS